MEPPSSALSPSLQRPEEDYEKMLRPKTLDEFIGQQKIKDNLRVFMTAALQRTETLDHVLLSGPPGLGKCITADSLILTSRGWVAFNELIPEGMKPDTSRPMEVRICGVHGLEMTSHIYASGRVPTRRIRTRSGFVLEGTPHHPVLVATPEGPEWKPLGQLSANDYVAIGRRLNVWGEAHQTTWKPDAPIHRRQRSEAIVTSFHTDLSEALGRPPAAVELCRTYAKVYGTSTSKAPQTAQRLGLALSDGRKLETAARPWEFVMPPVLDEGRTVVLDEDLAYLLGVLVGDGHLEKGSHFPAFIITCEEPEMQLELQRISRKHFGKAPTPRKYGNKATRLRFSQSIGRVCLAFGVKAVNAPDKGVPSAILRSPREVVIGFLQGLFDADGCAWPDGCVEFHTRSEELSRQVQLLLANLGLIAHRTEKQVAGAPFWQLFIGGRDAVLFHERVGFRLERKRARAASLQTRRRGWNRSDLVPCANKLLHALLRKSQPQPRAVHKTFDHVKRDNRTPSRRQIARYLSLLPNSVREEPEFRVLKSLTNPRIYWDRVADIHESEAEAFDFVVPGTHSFVANGFFNHNTTLAAIITEEMGAGITSTSGPVLEKPANIAGVLTNLNEGDVLFIDEIHRLSPVVEEYLYSAMEDYRIDILIDSGPNARSVKITLPPFTLIGATTRKGLLTAPLRARFGIDFRFDYYTADLLQQIVLRSARILGVEINDEGAFELARRSRGTPRIANRLLRRTRDFAEVDGDGRINVAMAAYALNALDVDEEGLDDMDHRILLTLIEKFGGGPTGLNNLSVSVGEDAGTIEEVYEPYLILEGFLERTARGRVATPRSYAHFGQEPPTRTGDLFGKG